MNFFNVIRTSKYLRIIYLNLPRGIRKRYIEFRALKHGKWTKTKIHKRQLEGLEALRNIHEGDTCVLMANGPSLKSTDWGLLKSLDIPIIGLNRIGNGNVFRFFNL